MAEVKSKARIMLDYNKAKKQAGSLEDAARAVRTESTRLQNCRADVTQAWQGDNAARFAGKMGLTAEDLSRIAGQLDKAADVIRKNARNIYDAEMEAKRLAEIRNHS